MAYPTKHRIGPNRRKLGKGQIPSSQAINVTITDSGSVATLTFSRAVNITGPIGMTATGLTVVSQAITGPNTATITYSGALTGVAYSLPSAPTTVSSYQGGYVLGQHGTFP